MSRQFALNLRGPYSTSFPTPETEISEGGIWLPHSTGSTIVTVGTNGAHGTQDGLSGFNDSAAYLSGKFSPDQRINATVYRVSGFAPAGGVTREVEGILRCSTNGWYECNYAFNGQYAQIVWVNLALGTFTYLVGDASGGNAGPAAGLANGDLLEFSIVGDTITSKHNGTTYATYTDTTVGGHARLLLGTPGMAFWRGGAVSTNDQNDGLGFSAWRATPL